MLMDVLNVPIYVILCREQLCCGDTGSVSTNNKLHCVKL
jgi:hypothetical protein